MTNTSPSIDSLLSEVGAFGRYQVITSVLICIPSILATAYSMNYVFTAITLDYRCKIPECDIGQNNREIPYNQPWLRSAIPLADNGKIENCFRYTTLQNGAHSPTNTQSPECPANQFNASQTMECTDFIYASDERNIQTEFNIHCADTYKLAFIGSAANIGFFIGLPLVGLLCDKFGRLKVTVLFLVGGAAIGLIKSISTSYLMFIMLELILSLGTNTFAGTFVLVSESTHSDYRILCSMLVGLAFPIGEILLGIVAAYVHDFRQLLQILHAPGLLMIIYLWKYPESIRWLLIKGRTEQAIKVLQQTASVNRRTLSSSSIAYIQNTYSVKSTANNIESNDEMLTICQSLHYILKSKCLMLRFISCCFIWIACCFCYYILSLRATKIAGENRYVNFIFMSAIEFPGILLAVPLLKKMRRKRMMFTLLFMTAIFAFVVTLIPADQSVLMLIAFLISKASITCAINAVYVYTVECWPTNIRNTVMNCCSMVGRLGAMVAPLIAVLEIYHASLPELISASVALIGAFLIRFCPETYNKKLPDTIQEL